MGDAVTPILVTTDVAAVFVARCLKETAGPDDVKRARFMVYNWAKVGRIEKHGGDKRGQARWDLHDLARMLDGRTTVVVL